MHNKFFQTLRPSLLAIAIFFIQPWEKLSAINNDEEPEITNIRNLYAPVRVQKKYDKHHWAGDNEFCTPGSRDSQMDHELASLNGKLASLKDRNKQEWKQDAIHNLTLVSEIAFLLTLIGETKWAERTLPQIRSLKIVACLGGIISTTLLLSMADTRKRSR